MKWESCARGQWYACNQEVLERRRASEGRSSESTKRLKVRKWGKEIERKMKGRGGGLGGKCTKILELVSRGVARARALLALRGVRHAHEALGAGPLVILRAGSRGALVAGVGHCALRGPNGRGDLLRHGQDVGGHGVQEVLQAVLGVRHCRGVVCSHDNKTESQGRHNQQLPTQKHRGASHDGGWRREDESKEHDDCIERRLFCASWHILVINITRGPS